MLTPTPDKTANIHPAADTTKRRDFVGDTPLALTWEVQDGGYAAACTLTAPTLKESTPFLLTLAEERFNFHFGENARGAIWLEFGAAKIQLRGDFSTGSHTGFAGVIDSWARPTRAESNRLKGRTLENPANPFELFSFLWTRPPQQTLPKSLAQAFVFLADPAALPLYVELEKLSREPDAGAKMRQAAFTFMGTPEYVGSLASLGLPAEKFPVLLASVSELTGTVTIADLVKLSEGVLGEPLAEYLKSAGFASVKARTWQSLFAFSLVAPPQLAPGQGLVDVLRASRLLEHIGAEDPALVEPKGRQEALTALVALPDAVAPGGGDLPGPLAASEEPPGWVRLLGVGDLKSIRQRLVRYDPGEVASIINVMPFERQEWTERELERTLESDKSASGLATEEDRSTDEQDHEDLRRELRDVALSESDSRDYNGLKVQYGPSGLEFTVSGAVIGTASGQQRADRHVMDLARSLTQRAAQRVAEKVARHRTRVRLEERERVRQRTFENGTRSESLIGVYRWVTKVHELRLEEVGRRLVLELLLLRPAARYVAGVELRQVAPLTRPAPLDELVKEPKDITADNYLRLAALYGVQDLAPPPENTRVLTATLQAGAALQVAEISVPEAYTATTAKVAWLLGDAQGKLVGSVGGITFSAPPGITSSAASGPGSAPLQSSSVPAQGSVSLEGLAAHERKIPVAALSNVPGVFVSVEVTCALSHGEERLAAWQLQTYEALRAGYFARLHAWERSLARHLREDSAGHEARIIQASLRDAALEALWARHAPSTGQESADLRRPAFLRLADQALGWDQLTYAFFPWGPGEPQGRAPRHWLGERLTHPGSRTLFEDFLWAGSARVLIPVRPGFELLVLFFLAYGQSWPGDVAWAPVLTSAIPLLADLFGLSGTPSREEVPWLVELPTPLLLLAGSTLPASAATLSPDSARKPGEAP